MKAIYKFDVPMNFKPKDCHLCHLWHQYSMGVGGCDVFRHSSAKSEAEYQCPLILEPEENEQELIIRLTQHGIQIYNTDGTLSSKQLIIDRLVNLHASIESDEVAEELLDLADEVDEML